MEIEDSSIREGLVRHTKSGAQLGKVEMKGEKMSNAEPDGFPDGFEFVLPFLDLLSRLQVEMLNRPLKEALKDPLVWVDLMVEGRASKMLTNELLLKLVKRADGHLKSLNIVNALGISDEILSKISELNPGLERISVPGCTGLNVENFVSFVEGHSRRAREKGLPGISQVRLRGLYNISPNHLERLGNALRLGGSGSPPNEALLIPRYYGNQQGHSETTDKRPVDVDVCPKCDNVRLLYDCTREGGCSDRNMPEGNYYYYEDEDELFIDKNIKSCRACRFCIPRCEECGICIRSARRVPYDEILCPGWVCNNCWFALPRCNGCNRPACSRHAGEIFPRGYDELCGGCHGNIEGPFMRNEQSPPYNSDDFKSGSCS